MDYATSNTQKTSLNRPKTYLTIRFSDKTQLSRTGSESGIGNLLHHKSREQSLDISEKE